MIHQNCLRYYKDIAIDPIYPGLVQDMTEGDRMAAAMGDNRILLHANHGIVVCAPTIWQVKLSCACCTGCVFCCLRRVIAPSA